MKNNKINLYKVSAAIMAILVLISVAFYYLAGEQLIYRESRSNIELLQPDAGVTELSEGVVVDQIFSTRINRIKSVTVLWGGYYRVNSGNITIQLLNVSTEEVYMEGTFDASQVGEGVPLTITAAEPLEGLYDVPLFIHITSDSLPGSSATPLYLTTGMKDGYTLFLNSQPIPGILSFSVYGEDYIWIGQNYWLLSAIFLVVIAVFLLIENLRYKYNKHSYLVDLILVFRKYSFLIEQLVSRDFKTKYKRSILGVFWSFLNPLLMMLVQFFVFSNLFKTEVQHFEMYLLVGTVCFNFFSETCNMSLVAILGNAGLLTKVYVPKYIYPLTKTLSAIINMSISIIPLIIVGLVTGINFEKSAILSIFFFACLIVFSFGLGLLLSSLMVFFRDMQFLWGVLTMVWMYATPIFYPKSIVPEEFAFVIEMNPLYHFIENIRSCIIGGFSPEPISYLICFFVALVMLFIGGIVFKNTQDKFVLYL